MRLTWGQTYPTRSVKIVVPAIPGGAIDQARRGEQPRHRLEPRDEQMAIYASSGAGSSMRVIQADVDEWGRIVRAAGIQPG